MKRLVLVVLLCQLGGALRAEPVTVGVMRDMLAPGMEPAVASIESALTAIGFRVTRLYADDLLKPLSCDLLLYPAGPRYPAGSEDTLRSFVNARGRLIVLGGPAFTKPAWKQGGAWRTWDELKSGLASAAREHVVIDFDRPEWVSGWARASNAPSSPGRASAGNYGGNRKSLQIDIPNLTGWDNWSHAVSGWPTGRNLLTFEARGDRSTGQMMVELRESDGSRWIAVEPIKAEWGFHALAPEEFRYWQDSASRGRGGAGDMVRLEHVRQISFGLAFSHTPMAGGPHRFWVGSVSLQPDPRAASVKPSEPIVLDGLTPAYKYFPIHNALRAEGSIQSLIGIGGYPLPSALFSVSPRPQGTGFHKGRSFRFIPLIEARDRGGKRAGYVAWMHLNTAGPLAGSAWAVFGTNDAGFYANPKARRAIVDLASAMTRRPLLAEGGAEYYACLPTDRSIRLGAGIMRTKSNSEDARIRISALAFGRRNYDFVHEWELDPQSTEVSHSWIPSPSARASENMLITTDLIYGGKVVDSVSHPLTLWQPKAPDKCEWVSSRAGRFWLHGTRWVAHGVNYMPSSGIALEDQEAFEQWLGAKAYDPDVIEEDLGRIASMGLNTISVFLYRSNMEARNLLDLLARAEAHGQKVNLSLRPHADPFDFRWDEVREMIQFLRLAENDTVFAYDLAWERGFGTYDGSYSNVRGRKAYDPQWRAWIAEQYGSVEAAEKDWGFAAPQRDGQVIGPSDEMLERNGPWKRMVAAYRRFVDDLSSRAYGRAARLIRSVDPHHLVSFRMNTAGDPTASPREFPFDFRGLARALDFMGPEGYGRQGDWNRVRDGLFTPAYSRYAAPGRPVLWTEFGMSTWAGSNFLQPNPAQEAAGSFYERFYRMVAGSASNGTSAWWFPGGYRLNENSDFGIMNPDGSNRPVTKVIRKAISELECNTVVPPVDTWIEVDRDADVRGIAGIYEACKAAFWKAVDSGRHPGLRDRGTGTTSANVPLVAVGGVPYNGHNPPRFLNAEFDRFEIQDAAGRWVDVTGGMLKGEENTVEVAAGKPVRARACVGNTATATWRASRVRLSTGDVVLDTTPESEVRLAAPARISSDVPTLGTATFSAFGLPPVSRESRVVVRMHAWNRMWFGENLAFRLKPTN